MHANFQDAMALCRRKGKPDYFITMTCNPDWPEIQEVLQEYFPGETVSDHPEITAKMFNLKLNALRHDILKRHGFG